jgi:UDP-GlcNAc:undecaprenyl-phosphate GlcNAc-1-phosphate transferase
MNVDFHTLEPVREVLAFAVSLTIGFISIVLLRRFWKWKRGLDAGDGVRKLQSKPVLRVGGISLYVVFVCSFFFAQDPVDTPSASLLGLPFLLLGTTMFLLGFADDLFGLPASFRLLVQVGVGMTAYLCGMEIDTLTHPFGGETIEMGGFALILTVAWFVAIPNLINLVDGMDGLAGGISLFLCLTLATLGGMSGNSELLILNLALAGGIVAFLAFNLPPAKIYMGDGGAYLLGFAIAGASLLSSNKASVFGSLIVVVIVLGFPILDTALAMLRRGLSGMPLMRADALHLHHRLLTLGFSKRNILLVLYGIFAGLSLLGLSVFLSAGYTLPIVGMVAVIGFFQGMRFLGLPHNFAEAKSAVIDIIAARKDVRYAYAMSQVLEHDLERYRTAEEFWDSLGGFLKRLQITPLALPDAPFPEGEESGLVVFKLDHRTIWLLRCPVPENGTRRWERVARCFYCPIMGARSRWGSQLPSSLGFFDVDSPEMLESLKSRLPGHLVPATSLARILHTGSENRV